MNVTWVTRRHDAPQQEAMMLRKTILGCAMVLCAATLTLAGTEGRWLHLQVLGDGEGGENVHLNLPLGDRVLAWTGVTCPWASWRKCFRPSGRSTSRMDG